MRNWILGSVTAVMGIGGLYVSSHAGFGVAYYGGLLFFLFSVFFIFMLINVGYDNVGETTSMSEFNAFYGKVTAYMKPAPATASPSEITVRSIGAADLREALARGYSDFMVRPTHLFFLCAVYPVVGLIFARLTFGYDVLPVLFPLVSGFAIIGPLAATGLYELSRRREQGLDFSWWHVFDVLHCPSIRSIVVLGLILALIFAAWLFAAQMIFGIFFGDWTPASISEFTSRVFTTPEGWKLIVVGCGVGFGFAVVSMVLSVFALPMLLDSNVGVLTAIDTSIRGVLANPKTIAVWGVIVVVALILGSIPLFMGLAVVLPVLGHATWHLYRKVVEH